MEDVKIENIKLSDSTSLYVKRLGTAYKKQILIIHDLGEYHDRYLELADNLSQNQIGCTFVDLRGHGLSSGTRGHFDSSEQLKEDLKFFNLHFENWYKDNDCYLLGHGFGAVLCINMLVEAKNFKGAILANPSIKYRNLPNLNLEDSLLRTSLFDKFRVPMGLLGNEVSREENIQIDYDHDPLVNKKVTLSSYKAVLDTINNVKQNSYYIDTNILYIIGKEDLVIDIELSQLFASSIDKRLLTTKVYEDVGHELFNEIDRDKVFKDIYNWIEEIN